MADPKRPAIRPLEDKFAKLRQRGTKQQNAPQEPRAGHSSHNMFK